MDEPHYPHLTTSEIVTLQIILEGWSKYPDYFGPKCPFPAEIKAGFRNFSSSRGSGMSNFEALDLEDESEQLYRQLKSFGSDFKDVSTAEQMQFYRTATTLMEKLLTLKERAANVKAVEKYYATVVECMEAMDVPERSRFVALLKERAGQ